MDCLIARVKVAHVAERPCRLNCYGWGFTQRIEGGVINPSLARAKQNHSDIDSVSVGFDIAGYFVVAPLPLANGAVVHVVEESHFTVVAIHAEPELSPVALRNAADANCCSKADPFAAIRGRVEALHEVPKPPLRTLSVSSKFQTQPTGLRIFRGKFRRITGCRNRPALREGAWLAVFESKILRCGLSKCDADQYRHRGYEFRQLSAHGMPPLRELYFARSCLL